MSDLISRQDAIKNAHFPVIDDASYEVVRVDDILALPSADRPTGEWIEVEDYDGDIHYQCDYCKAEYVLIDGTPKDNDYNYCPHCGTKMGGRIMGMTFEINSLEDMCDVMCDNIIPEKSMSKYEALIELRKIYTNPLLDLSLKAKLKQIIQVLEEQI